MYIYYLALKNCIVLLLLRYSSRPYCNIIVRSGVNTVEEGGYGCRIRPLDSALLMGWNFETKYMCFWLNLLQVDDQIQRIINGI